MNATQEFRDAIHAAGLTPPASIVPGKFRRFPGVGKNKGDTSGYCKMFQDGEGGCFGDWASGNTGEWQAKREIPRTNIEQAAFKRQVAEARAKAEAEQVARNCAAAIEAEAIWQKAVPAVDGHPYLASKFVKANGARTLEGRLIVPLRDKTKIQSIQYIDKDGGKLFHLGGRTKGCYFSIGDLNGAMALCIAEGFATGATIHEATGHPVAVAFNAGNLEAVATAMREQFPKLPIILCADDDSATPGNPGMTKAMAAAQAVGGLLAMPDFGPARPQGATDFNDMAKHCGLEAVKRTIASVNPEHPDCLDDHLVSFDDLTGCDEPQPHYVEKWVPAGEVTLMAGHGGGGKSYIALLIAMCVALGLPFSGLVTKQANTLFYSAEDGKGVLLHRLKRICDVLRIDPATLNGKLHLLDASDLDPALHREQKTYVGKEQRINLETPMLGELADLVKRLDAGFVVIDNASDAYDDDEIKRSRVRAFIRSLRTQIARPGRAVLLLAHINKESAKHGKGAGAEDYSGSTAWHNSVRSRVSLQPDDDRTNLVHAKANLGPKAAPVTIEWQGGVPVVLGSEATPGAEMAKELARKAEADRDGRDMDALVTLIESFDQRGERVTTSAMGNATVYKLLKAEPGFPKGTGPDRLMPLLRQLESDGRIYRRTTKTADRKLREVFTCVPGRASAPMQGQSVGSTGGGNGTVSGIECANEA